MSEEWTQERLDECLAYWQKALRLQDWDVKIRLSRASGMGADRLGEVVITLSKKEALVKILDPIDYPPDAEWAHDIEGTIVHELLHLHIEPFSPEKGLEYTAMEQAIDAMARGYVTVKRGGGTI